MVNFSQWKVIVILMISLLGFLYAVPNLVTADQAAAWREKVPGWFPGQQVNLGLDLRGGAYVLIGVEVSEVVTERLEAVASSARAKLREEGIRYRDLGADAHSATFTLREPEQDLETVRKFARRLDDNLLVEIDEENGKVVMTFDEAGRQAIVDDAMALSVEVIRNRIDQSGLLEPQITRQGENRILLQLPGITDTSRILEIITSTAKLSFHLLDDTATPEQIVNRMLPQGSMLVPAYEPLPTDPPEYAVRRRVEIQGEHLADAQATLQQNEAVVSFRFDRVGARRFCDVTKDNVGRPLAILLERTKDAPEVISAPRINEPICAGSGVISGNFTIESANDLAILLRSGALPATINVLEERTVGPSLGHDSIEAGRIASVIALAAVIVFMVLAYGLFGLFATVALFVNIALIFGLLTILQATLTLPGLAGIVLTIGMAVDANVLIFERIR